MKRMIVEIVAAGVFFAAGWFGYQRTHPADAAFPEPAAERLSAARQACAYWLTLLPYERAFARRDECVARMLGWYPQPGQAQSDLQSLLEPKCKDAGACLAESWGLLRPIPQRRIKKAGSPSP